MDVASWMRNLGLERYEATFRENDVDAELLPNLTADDLKDLGVTLVGHRRRPSKRSLRCAAKLPRPEIPYERLMVRRGISARQGPRPNAAR